MEGLRERLTFANLVSAIALFVAMGGSAYAVTIGRDDVGAPQIAKNAVGTSELKDNKTKGRDIDESSLAQVPSATNAESANTANTANTAGEATHAASADSAANATNLGGFGAGEYLRFGGEIPSGKSVRGAWGVMESNLLVGGLAMTTVSLPLPAPVQLTNENVNFAPSASVQDGDAACTGTTNAPTAPPGKVCLYITFAGNAGSSLRGNRLGTSGSTDGNQFSFHVLANAAVAGTLETVGTWAYTAP